MSSAASVVSAAAAMTPNLNCSPLSGNPSDLINTLILRQRALSNTTANQAYQDRYPTFSDEQILTAVDVILAGQAGQVKIVPSHGTTVACTKCARLNAPAYYLKRSHGRYAVLCFDNGQGCWERSATSLCSYVDQTDTQCMDLAEWVVAYGPDMIKERHVCGMHISGVLSDVTEHRVFALQD